ncbi:MAG: hypothetical protein AAFR81_19335 [Chloroflexota bacterium]
MIHLKKPRCYLLVAHAPENVTPSRANDIFNAFVAERRLPLVIFHDHFIGQLGGVALFFIENAEERAMLEQHSLLATWSCQLYPLIYAYNPAAVDEQITYTLKHYRDVDWQMLRHEKRPHYGDPNREAQTGQEDENV